ncbi:oxygenase MpaB family protein [Entomohabitans teleogrylli]|uniref:oxygenase MpaB family protein n=1 Tax=Entomohabitans teleogrylli TaxID=1384589 RepID=UPI00073D5D03|nr:oxygenase MpaB family protein [Entomohabitans teleogrylli]
MNSLRQKIANSVHSISGVGLGNFVLDAPPGEPGLYPPNGIVWRVNSDFTAMLCGGISALLLQMLHPLALAGVWDHSNFRHDMTGRLRRTSQFIAVTTFGTRADAQMLIRQVRAIHDRVTGVDNQGVAYSANDPQLLTWVHVAEVSSFLSAHLRYCNPDLSLQEQDSYLRDSARVAIALGARDVPRSRAEVADYFTQLRPQLRCDERTREVMQLLLNAPAPVAAARPVTKAFMLAASDLLPRWAQEMAGLKASPLRRRLSRQTIHAVAGVLRWAVQNGAYHRACRRMGITPVIR